MRARMRVFLFAALMLVVGGFAFAQSDTTDPPLVHPIPDSLLVGAPVACDVTAEDAPDDGGGAIVVTWDVPVGASDVREFTILRYASGEAPAPIGTAPASDREFVDDGAEDGTPYQYVVRTLTDAGYCESEGTGPVTARAQWFASNRTVKALLRIRSTSTVARMASRWAVVVSSHVEVEPIRSWRAQDALPAR